MAGKTHRRLGYAPAQFIPYLLSVVGRHRVIEFYLDFGASGQRPRDDLLNPWEFLNRPFQDLGNFLFDVQRRSPGVLRENVGYLDRIGWVLELRDTLPTDQPSEQAAQHHHPDKQGIRQCKVGQ